MANFRKMRTVLNIAMFASLTASAGFCITGGFLHEAVGAVTFVLFLIHAFLNRRWFGSVVSGGYSAPRFLGTAANFSLALLSIIVFSTGAMLSTYLFDFGGASMQVRQVHSVCGYWLFVLAGVHIGLHGFGLRLGGALWLRVLWVSGVLALAAFGAWSWGERAMSDKLFFGYSFDFWNGDYPSVLFFAENVSIAYVAAFSVRVFLQVLKKLKNKGKAKK